jgi:hypothetical protein
MKYSILGSNGAVEIREDSSAELPVGATLLTDDEFEALRNQPLPQASGIPQTVSKFQAKAALLNVGMLEQVEALMANPATPAITRLAWTEVQNFERSSPTIASMAAALGLNEAQIDALFIAASKITA